MNYLPYKIGQTISFSGQIGRKRRGIIRKIWGKDIGHMKVVHFAHVDAEPEYIFENNPHFMIVCLTPGHYDHPYCQVEK